MPDKPRLLLPPGGISMGGQFQVRYAQPEPEPWWARPMNCQAARLEMVRELIRQCGVQRFVETGTF